MSVRVCAYIYIYMNFLTSAHAAHSCCIRKNFMDASMYVCMYVYTHIHVHKFTATQFHFVFVCICAYVCMYIQTCTHTCSLSAHLLSQYMAEISPRGTEFIMSEIACVCMSMCVYVCIHTYVHTTETCPCIYTYILNTCKHLSDFSLCPHTRIHAYIHAYLACKRCQRATKCSYTHAHIHTDL